MMTCKHVMKEGLFEISGVPECPFCELDRLRAENERLRAELDKAMRIVGTSLHSDAATERIKLENDRLRAERMR